MNEQTVKETLGLEDEKNVRLTVVGLGGEEDDAIDLGIIGKQAKRLFALWLCFALGFGALSGAAALAVQRFFLTEEIKALVSFSDSDTTYDIRKIKSPAVVETALNELNRDILDLERVRNAIHISGVIPDGAYDQMSMFYNIVSEGKSESAVHSLLDSSFSVSRYVISFDYAKAKFSLDEGVAFMNTLLEAYQDYFAKTYNYNTSMGNALGAVDYKDYDYAEAVNIFSTSLNNLTSYLSEVEESATATFRSVETGFTFQDLARTASTLRGVDLDRISSYIVIHSVSSFDAATEISYYRWLIENLTRERTIQRTRLASLTRSIEEYEKDPILIAVQDRGSVVADMEDLNGSYDSMIREKLSVQATIASYSRSISYYESVIEGFENGQNPSPENIEKVKNDLAALNEKVNLLIENATKTVDEYYERAAFANRIRVLIPATGKHSPFISKTVVMIVFAVEALIFCIFGMIAFVKGLEAQRAMKADSQPKDESRKA